ncbi:MAG: hypothetical protein V2A62_04995 [Candidatus Woesearchaeota archaeon]
MIFTSNYHENLAILLEAGYPIAKANRLASVAAKQRKLEEKKVFMAKVNNELQDLFEKVK